MKKLLLSLLTAASLGFSTNAEVALIYANTATDLPTADFSQSLTGNVADNSYTVGDITFAFEKNNNNTSNVNGNLVRFYKDDNLIISASTNINITKITIPCSSTSYNKFKITSPTGETISTAQTQEWSSSTGYNSITLNATAQCRFSYIAVEYHKNVVDERKPAEISWDGEPKYELTIGENVLSFESPKLNNPHNLDVNYSLFVTPVESKIATIDNDGNVTLKEEEGNVVVFATFEGNEEYAPDEVSYAIEIKMPARKDAEISFGDVTSFTALLGSTFNAPELINPNTLNVTYSSSKEDVATVASDGSVMLKAAGQTIITASFAGNAEFEPISVSYTLTVLDPNNLSVVIDCSTLGLANDKAVEKIDYNPVTITFSKGNNTSGNVPKFFTSNNTIRLYAGNTMNFAIAEGYYITNISFEGTALTAMKSTDEKYSNSSWSGKATSVEFTATDKPQFTKITVKYAIAKKEPVLYFSETAVEVEENSEDFEAPELINENNISVVYQSSDEDVAVVDETTGDVLIGKRGQATITATFAGNDEFEPAMAFYTITVFSNKKYCATPTFSATEILVGETVTISCETEGATILYTVTGPEEFEDMDVINPEITFTLPGSYEISAVASAEGYEDSDEATATITVTVPVITEEVTFDFVNNDYGMVRLSGTTQEYNPQNVRFGNGWVICDVDGKTRLWSDGLRVYKDTKTTITITAPNSVVIKSVSAPIYATGGKNPESYATFTIEKNTASYSYTPTANKAIQTIEITYEGTEDDHAAIAEDFRNSSAEHFTILVNGEAHSAPVITKDQQSDVVVTLSHVYPHASIFTKWESADEAPEIEAAGMYYDVVDGFTKHEGDMAIKSAGTLSYYAELNGHQTAIQSIGVEGPTTSISEIEAESGAVRCYDLQGRRVQAPVRGLYIINGKKVIR